MYGSGLRLMECCRLRVKDLDFGMNEILVRKGKGNRDRHTILPKTLIKPLKNQIDTVRAVHNFDSEMGCSEVWLPNALAKKYLRIAIKKSDILKQTSSHTFRHSYELRTIQELLGHSDVRTTEIYTHVLNKGGRGVFSPID